MKDNEASQMYGDAPGTQTWLAQMRPALSADDGLSASIQGIEALSLDVVYSLGLVIKVLNP